MSRSSWHSHRSIEKNKGRVGKPWSVEDPTHLRHFLLALACPIYLNQNIAGSNPWSSFSAGPGFSHPSGLGLWVVLLYISQFRATFSFTTQPIMFLPCLSWPPLFFSSLYLQTLSSSYEGSSKHMSKPLRQFPFIFPSTMPVCKFPLICYFLILCFLCTGLFYTSLWHDFFLMFSITKHS